MKGEVRFGLVVGPDRFTEVVLNRVRRDENVERCLFCGDIREHVELYARKEEVCNLFAIES